MSAKKTPMRMCMGCREMKSKKELIRIVKTPEDEIQIDFSGKKNGRGAYLCKNIDCLKKIEKTGAISRAFSMTIDKSIYERLGEEIKELE